MGIIVHGDLPTLPEKIATLGGLADTKRHTQESLTIFKHRYQATRLGLAGLPAHSCDLSLEVACCQDEVRERKATDSMRNMRDENFKSEREKF